MTMIAMFMPILDTDPKLSAAGLADQDTKSLATILRHLGSIVFHRTGQKSPIYRASKSLDNPYPTARWMTESFDNWNWALESAIELLRIHRVRYGKNDNDKMEKQAEFCLHHAVSMQSATWDFAGITRFPEFEEGITTFGAANTPEQAVLMTRRWYAAREKRIMLGCIAEDVFRTFRHTPLLHYHNVPRWTKPVSRPVWMPPEVHKSHRLVEDDVIKRVRPLVLRSDFDGMDRKHGFQHWPMTKQLDILKVLLDHYEWVDEDTKACTRGYSVERLDFA